MELTVKHSTYIAVSPAETYKALATSEGLDAWFTKGAEVDAREGGYIHFRWEDFGLDRLMLEDGGPVLEAEPGKKLVFGWHPAGPDKPTTVTLELSGYGKGTRLDVTEIGHLVSDTAGGWQAALTVAVGWGEALTLLKYYLEQREAYRHPCAWYRDAHEHG